VGILKSRLGHAPDQYQNQVQKLSTGETGSLKTAYRQFFKLIPNLKVEKFPQINVVFPHELKVDKKKL